MKAANRQHKRKVEGRARWRGVGVIVVVVVLVLGAAGAWWVANKPSRSERRAGDSAPYHTTNASPAELERALRAEQLRTAEELVRAFPESDDAVYLLGLVHNEQGNTETAIQYWKRALELDPTRADANDSLGHALLLRDEYEQAEGYFRKALAIDPALATANARLAGALMRQGKVGAAASVLEKAASLNAEGHRLLGEAYEKQGEFEKAKANYTKAIALNSELTQAYYGLSRVLKRLGEDAQAEKYFQTFSVLRERGEERDREVRANYDTMAITKKNVAQTHTDIGRVYMTKGRVQEAERLWRKANQLDPQNALCRLQLAVLSQQTGRHREALVHYEEVAKADPNDALLQLNIGRVCVKLNEMERAEQAFARAVRLAPDQAEAHSSLAEFYLQTRRNFAEAVARAESAVKLAPEAKYYALLGQAYAMSNDRAGALAAFNRAIELKPDNPQYAQFRAMLLEKP